MLHRIVEDQRDAAVDDAAAHDHLGVAAPLVTVQPLLSGELLAHRGDDVRFVVVNFVSCHFDFSFHYAE